MPTLLTANTNGMTDSMRNFGKFRNTEGVLWTFQKLTPKLEQAYVLEIFANNQAFLNYHDKPIDPKY